jgi:hypothetical protein
VIDKCVHINCQRVQLFRLGQLPMRHFQRASLAHIPRLSHRKRLVIVPGMHEETPRSSRGHIQARLGGKVNNRVALSTSSRRIESTETSTPRASLPLQKSHTRFSSSYL